jgi:hypothetical protein
VPRYGGSSEQTEVFRVIDPFGRVYGPYLNLAVARGIVTRESSHRDGAVYRIERSDLNWEAVE